MEMRSMTPDEKKAYEDFVKHFEPAPAEEVEVDKSLFAAFMKQSKQSIPSQDQVIQAEAKNLVRKFNIKGVPSPSTTSSSSDQAKFAMKRPFPSRKPQRPVLSRKRQMSTTQFPLHTDSTKSDTHVPIRVIVDLSPLAPDLKTRNGKAISSSASKQFSIKLNGFPFSPVYENDEFLGALSIFTDDVLQIPIYMPVVENPLLATTDTTSVRRAADLSSLLTLVNDSQTPHPFREVCTLLLESTTHNDSDLLEHELLISFGLHKKDSACATGAVAYNTLEALGHALLSLSTKPTQPKRHLIFKLTWQNANNGRIYSLYAPPSETPVIENSDGDQRQEILGVENQEAFGQDHGEEVVVEVHDTSDDESFYLDSEWNFNNNNNSNSNDPLTDENLTSDHVQPMKPMGISSPPSVPLQAANVTPSESTSTDNWESQRRKSVEKMQVGYNIAHMYCVAF
uniref:Uncharacterized protein n=1 Tax=Octactis speculum TaxID=3111310 RepID=A0A7S2ANX2_9STRA|mmetsp:Transcript_13340/g.17618  ORF Transcript_13340/g.17618 Transcript_13340/m.17618 type:complete len:453 (+) Transcript_13340:80-1438(+)